MAVWIWDLLGWGNVTAGCARVQETSSRRGRTRDGAHGRGTARREQVPKLTDAVLLEIDGDVTCVEMEVLIRQTVPCLGQATPREVRPSPACSSSSSRRRFALIIGADSACCWCDSGFKRRIRRAARVEPGASV